MNTLQDLFKMMLNMSVTATYVAIGVITVRFILRKGPKIFSYILWSVVLLRLICPLSFTLDFSFLSLMNHAPNSISSLDNMLNDLVFMQNPSQQSDMELNDPEINATLLQDMPNSNTELMQKWMYVFSIIWIIGVIVLLSYTIIIYIKMHNRLNTATLLNDNVYESDRICTAFVYGFFRPKIFVPIDISETDSAFILEHERIHIYRKDYLIKPLAFTILILHWFNPFMWLSYILMNKDMEMSCDESVLRKMGERAKGGYSGSLLALSMKRSGLLTVNPIAFGESNVKARIKNVLKFKKPKFWVIAATVIIVIIGITGLLANPSKVEDIIDTPDQMSNTQQITPEPSKWLPEQNIGADMAVLDYASDEIVIFHGYFGLFVYDLNTLQINRSLDLETLNCNKTQGDDYCEVSVSLDGNTVQLHPMSSEDMYVYTVSSQTLQKSNYQTMQNAFGSQFVSAEEVVATEHERYSINAVQFNTDEYGLLYTTDWTLGTLSYIRGDKKYGLFQINPDSPID